MLNLCQHKKVNQFTVLKNWLRFFTRYRLWFLWNCEKVLSRIIISLYFSPKEETFIPDLLSLDAKFKSFKSHFTILIITLKFAKIQKPCKILNWRVLWTEPKPASLWARTNCSSGLWTSLNCSHENQMILMRVGALSFEVLCWESWCSCLACSAWTPGSHIYLTCLVFLAECLQLDRKLKKQEKQFTKIYLIILMETFFLHNS